MMNPLFPRVPPIPPAPAEKLRIWKSLGPVAYEGDRVATAWYGLRSFGADLSVADELELKGIARTMFQWVAQHDNWQGREIATLRPDRVVTLRFEEVNGGEAHVVTIN